MLDKIESIRKERVELPTPSNNEDDFVEFYVGNGPREIQNQPTAPVSPLKGDKSSDSLVKKLKVKRYEDVHPEFIQDDDEDGWLDMEVANDQEVYDEKGQLVADNHFKKEWNESDENFGYTRIVAEKQAEAYQKSDKKTDFLFTSDKANESKENINDNDDTEEEEEDDTFVATESSTEQIRSTKDMLEDSQKFAYVGLVKLIMVEMATELATISTLVNNKSSKSRFIKRMNLAQSSFGEWQRKLTDKLYDHLELTIDEINMIESLSKHGILVEDLTKSLKKKRVVKQSEIDESDISKDLKDKDLEVDIAWTILCDLFLVLLSDAVYDARSRALYIKFSQYLDQDPIDVFQFERRITESLQLEDSGDQVWNEEDLLKERSKKSKKKKYMYVGLATIGGSLVIGLSAGLLAPVIGAGLAAGLTTIGITGTSGFLAGAGGAALVSVGGTAIGARMGAMGMLKRVQDVKTFEFVPLHNNRRTNLIVTVSGWMSGKADDIRLPFSTVDPVMGDLYSLLWEPEMLTSTGQTISILTTEALTQSIQQILGATLLIGLMSAINIPMMLSKLYYIVDNPWNVSLDRAWKAGYILADTLISRNLGDRPVTLVGFSLGSRVIYSCLLELAKRGAYGLVEKVILFGSPFVISVDQLITARSVVAGDFINGYSRKDWILGYLFRATSGGLGRVAGLSPIDEEYGIKNFDCTDHIEGHLTYRKHMPYLLSQLGFSVLSEEFIEIDDEPDPEVAERQRKLIHEFDEAKKMMDNEIKNGKKRSRNSNGLWGKLFKSKKKQWWEMYSVDKAKSTESLSIESGDITEPRDVFDLDGLVNRVQEVQINEDDSKIDSVTLSSEDETLKDGDNEKPEDFELKLAEEDEELEDDSKTVSESTSEIDLSKNSNKNNNDDDDEFHKEENITMTFA